MGKTFRRNGSESYSFGKSIRDKRQKGSKNRIIKYYVIDYNIKKDSYCLVI